MRLLSAIKKDMDFNLNLYNLIEVLKEIAIAQYKILEKKLKTFDEVFNHLGTIFDLLQVGNTGHPLLNPAGRQAGVIALTSDAGLLGGLNMSVMSQAIKEADKVKGRLIIVGEKGQMYAQETDLPFIVFKGVKDETRFEQAQQLRDYVLAEELSGKLGQLKIVYPVALSIVSQQVKTLQLFPFSTAEHLQRRPAPAIAANGVILESAVGDILEYWIHLFLAQKFYQIFGLSRLAELSARYNHLETSKGKIDNLNKELKLQYFRQRHEMIDKNIRELFCARLAFK
ncbi:MAG TPA: FoF1 ATP synthase subunit gamma [Candidatus Omnitrophota bacterium]|nr:FoF1 ATP synthase subunit gamma [Candidatus Omnitrophota bacterium]HRZ14478.1 FoF1 ATP synthase subunit gamma [Candidatus Omnitrophota bacterium]